MPLESSCEEQKGKRIFIWPIVGFGWDQINTQAPPFQPGEAMAPPSPFHAKLEEFHYFNSQIEAGIAIVEEPNHQLDQKWVAFCLRDRGVDLYNLTTNPGKYNVCIGNVKPIIQISLDIPMPLWMRFERFPVSSGLGYIAASRRCLEEKFEWLNRTTNQ
jgi:hypothetical protein